MWVKVDSFEEVFSLKDPIAWPVHVAEDALARTETSLEKLVRWKYELYLRERGKEWRPLAKDMWDRLFLTNDLLLVGVEGGFRVVNRQGVVVFEGKTNDKKLTIVKSSLDGSRFAIFDMKRAILIIEKHDFFDARFILRVFDVKSKSLVAEKGFAVHDARQVKLALSPDGSRLAILTGPKLQVFVLPPP